MSDECVSLKCLKAGKMNGTKLKSALICWRDDNDKIVKHNFLLPKLY